MGFRFHKSFKILPGIKLNINKKSVGVTLGTKGAHYTINSKGKRTASVSLPGTGLSYSTSVGGTKNKQKDTPKNKINNVIRIGIAIVVVVCVALAIKSHFADKATTASSQTTAVTQSAEASTDTSAEMKPAGAAGTASAGDTVWVSESGSKYHSKSDCSGMEDAKEITLEEAEKDGKTACKRCY